MRFRTPPVVALVALVGAAVAPAQPPLRPTPRPPVVLRSFGPAGPPAAVAPVQSQIGVWAGQLAANVQAARAAVPAVPMPYQQRITLSVAADRAAQATAEFARLAQQTADPAGLAAAHEPLDAAVGYLATTARQLAAGNEPLAQAVARAQYADERLHAALGGAAPEDRRGAVPRLAQVLENQADRLRGLVEATPDPRGANRDLVRHAREFARRGDRLVAAAKGGNVDDSRAIYLELATDWQVVTAELAPLAAVSPPVRVQAAQVDGLLRDFAAAVGGVEPPPPNPAFGVVTRKDKVFVVGAGEGGVPRVRVFHDLKGGASSDFFAYDPGFRGGVRVAVADVNGDGFPDVVTAPGKGMLPLVRVFNGRDLSLMSEFLAYDRGFDGGVYVAAADLTRDGRAIVVTGPGAGGGPHVRLFDLAQGKEVAALFPYPFESRGGARVAVGDVDGDGLPDLITAPGPGLPSLVRVFSGATQKVIAEFDAYGPEWTGGVFVAAGDIRGDGRAEVLTGTDAGGPAAVRVFNVTRRKVAAELTPYPPEFRGGVRVATFDANDDGALDVVCAPGAGVPGPVRVYDGKTRTLLGEFPAFEGFPGGAFVAGR